MTSLDAILELPAEWQLVILHTVKNGRCSCYKGKECDNPGKHPRMKGWQDLASHDEQYLQEMLAKYPGCNVGVLLGPRSGIVDIEYDDDAGKATASRFLTDIVTPTYQSSRGLHSLFRWSSKLPNVQKRIIDGLECRLGGGDKAAQSVVPPSVRPNGEPYVWLPGLSPTEVEIADLPALLVVAMFNDEDLVANNGAPSRAATIYQGKKVSEGERNETLFSFACSQAARSPDIANPQEQAHLYDVLMGVNAVRIHPPLEEGEVRKVHQSAIGYAKRDKVKKTSDTSNYTQHGLQMGESGEWLPGEWQLTVVTSDPPQYLLMVPAWTNLIGDGSGTVAMSLEAFSDAGAVAKSVLAATRTIILDEYPRLWPAIWNGTAGSKDKPPKVGLKVRLMDGHETIDPPPTEKRYVVVAEYLSDRIGRARAPLDGDVPADSSLPTKRKDGTVWARWSKLWNDGLMTGQIKAGEPELLARRLGVTKSDYRLYPSRGTPRLRFLVLTATHLATLDQIICGDQEGDDA